MSSKYKTSDTFHSKSSKYEVREKKGVFKNKYHVNKNDEVDSGNFSSRKKAVEHAKKKSGNQ